MSQDESRVANESGRVSAPGNSTGTHPGPSMGGYGLAMSSFLDRHPVIRRQRWFIAMGILGVLMVGVFSATHGACASDDLSCSSADVQRTVGDLAHKRIDSGPKAGPFVPERFSFRISNVVTEDESPLSCSADFKPTVAMTKNWAEVMLGSTDPAVVHRAEVAFGETLSTRLTYTVKRTDKGNLYVRVIDGLDPFD